VFFAIHDPTTLNRQGNDVGTQYRSVIFFHTPEQHDTAVAFVEDLEKRKIFRDKVVTEISPLLNYFPAEKYHQEYFENNPMQPYCAYVVAPKVEKAEDLFGDLFKR
jgi:peptide-methionine (S)-S-oxide reductase